jgi:hypothetical protein
VDGCLPNSQGGSPRGNANYLEASPSNPQKKIEKKIKKKKKRASSSSLKKSKDITKVSVQAVRTRGKSPSTPEATPQQSGNHWKEGGW